MDMNFTIEEIAQALGEKDLIIAQLNRVLKMKDATIAAQLKEIDDLKNPKKALEFSKEAKA